MDTAEKGPQPREVATEFLARCVHCGTILYTETVVERPNDAGELVEVERSDTGALMTCPCRIAPPSTVGTG